MIALSLIITAAAVAQGALSDETELSAKETRKIVAEIGDCIVQRQQRRASEAILANLDNAELHRKYGKLLDGTCIPIRPGPIAEIRFQGDQFRYLLADALVRRELAALPPPRLDAVPKLDHREPGGPPSLLTAKGKPLSEKQYQQALEAHRHAQAFSYLSRYGECVVRVDTVGSRTLLAAKPESAEEANGFAALRLALATCLPEGRTLKFGKLALRGTIAVNYYRLAKAALAAVPAGARQ